MHGPFRTEQLARRRQLEHAAAGHGLLENLGLGLGNGRMRAPAEGQPECG
jgi:hypothetical protein